MSNSYRIRHHVDHKSNVQSVERPSHSEYIIYVSIHQRQTDDVYVKVRDVTSGRVGDDARVAAGVGGRGRANNQRLRHTVHQHRPPGVGCRRPVDVPRDRRTWTSGLDATRESQSATLDDDYVTAAVDDIRLD